MITDSRNFKTIVNPNPDEIRNAQSLAGKISHNRREGFNGSVSQNVSGILAEILFHRKLMLNFDDSTDGHDGGADVILNGKRIDIKTQRRRSETQLYFAQDLNAWQVDNPELRTDVYLFTSHNLTTNQIEFLGWLRKWDMKREWHHRKGEQRRGMSPKIPPVQSDCYVIPIKALNPFSFGSFAFEMECFSTT